MVLFFRNITELADVVTKAAFYFGHLFHLLQDSSAATGQLLLEDYLGCGVRNNDTFSYFPAADINYIRYGSQATANWSVECLWDCTWRPNPYLGQQYDIPYQGSVLSILSSMPKVPVDLRCLDGCTDVQPLFKDYGVDCSTSVWRPFLACYIFLTQYVRIGSYQQNTGIFVSQNYFHLAVEACLLAIQEPSLYGEGNNCDTLGVNLSVFNYNLPPSYLSSSLPKTKLQGPATEEATAFAGFDGEKIPMKNRQPWVCSLRTPGYRGLHRSGVTLLSGPPKPTIFVSAAHCNYLCKDALGRVVEICCCKDPLSRFACSTNDFCGRNSSLQLAAPQDLQIVCNIRTQETLPQGVGYPNVTVLDILEIRNHPDYRPVVQGSQEGGPIWGHDISVYIVDDSKLAQRMNTTSIWPACLPTADKAYVPGNRGILAGWSEPLPTYLGAGTNLQDYANQYLVGREALFEGQPACADPAWMKSNTYYPAGTTCYTVVAWAGSVQFGISGSGLVRPFLASDGEQTCYSWVGPLSLSKGSDRTVLSDYSGLIDYSSNPAVFTDGRCYLDWIAAQYGLSMPAGYTRPEACAVASGDRAAVNNTKCLSRALYFKQISSQTTKCKFLPGGAREKCLLYAADERAQPTYNLNFYYCYDILDQLAICANDCPGVDPNAVVVGGEAALVGLAVAASVGPDLLGPLLGAGVGLAGLGLSQVGSMTRTACPAGQCRDRVSRQCCSFVFRNGRQLCPLSC